MASRPAAAPATPAAASATDRGARKPARPRPQRSGGASAPKSTRSRRLLALSPAQKRNAGTADQPRRVDDELSWLDFVALAGLEGHPAARVEPSGALHRTDDGGTGARGIGRIGEDQVE